MIRETVGYVRLARRLDFFCMWGAIRFRQEKFLLWFGFEKLMLQQ